MLLPGNESSGWAELRESNRSGPGPEGGGPGPEAVIVPVVFGLIFVLGVVGNCLVMAVLGRVRLGGARGSGGSVRPGPLRAGAPLRAGSSSALFLLNLSVADLGFLLCCVPLHATVYSLPDWVFGGFFCWFGHFFASVSMLVSVFTLVAVSVDRYVAVVLSRRPAAARSRRAALAALCVIWTASLLLSVPVARHQVLTGHPSAPNSTFCWERWSGASRAAYRVSVLLVGYLLPLLLISCCYAKVLFHLHKNMKNMSKKSERSKRKTAQMVLLVVAAFTICWMPHHIIAMWVEFGTFPLNDASFAFRIVSHCLSYGNSCVNPILYAFMSENFRMACRQVFTCCLPYPPPPNGKVVRFRMESASTTHSTTNI